VKPKCATFTHLVKVQLINFDRLISGDQPTVQRHEWPARLRNIRKPTMNDEDHLWSLEEKFWLEGLDSARHMTAKGAVFVFPYPVGMLQGEALWQEKSVAQRWRTVSMTRVFSSERMTSLCWPITFLRSAQIYQFMRQCALRPMSKITKRGCV